VIYSDPGLKSWYPSIGHQRWDGHFEGCGPWYSWMVELGYPNLDIQKWNDGEWAIIEFYQAPIIPAETRWNFVLQGLKNILITPGFVERYVHGLDLHRKEVWQALDAKEKDQDEEKARLDKHAEDTAERAKNVIMGNEALMERIVKKGLKEMDLDKIAKNIPRHQLIGHKPPEVP
jgi:hypothetical protein